MTKRQKRLQRIRQNSNNVSLDDLRKVLEDYGFEYRQTVGSHFTFSYVIGGQTKLFVVPFRRPIKPIYVKRALKIIDEVIQERGANEPDENDSEEKSWVLYGAALHHRAYA
jgi:hypothetical protein